MIDRYGEFDEYCGGMVPRPTGDYVLYTDHEAEIARLR